VLERYDELKDRLRAPMLERALQYLSDVGEVPDQLVLVVSDRPEGTPYRESDTCYAGQVLATLLRERYDIQKKTSIKRLSGVPAMIDPVMRDLEG
jgi:hypothetical protein